MLSVYIGNLSFRATEEDVRAIFAEYGAVKTVKLPTDRETGRMRGFGFVEMESEAEETEAIDALNEAEWMGRILRVNQARPRTEQRSFSRQ